MDEAIWSQSPKPFEDPEAIAAARTSLLAFTTYTSPGYKTGWFNREVCAKLDRFLDAVARGENPRLMLFAPPRHGKSEIVSRKFPAYALGRHPDFSVIAASYSASLSERLNRDVQRVIDSPAYERLFPDTRLWGMGPRNSLTPSLRTSEIFEVVGREGTYRSAGVGGGITGMGAKILQIDDPIKDAEQAASESYREKVWEWYTSTLYTRQDTNAGILLIMTRWHEDDLAGRLLAAAEADGDKWEVVSFAAIAEHDEEFRKAGEALHSERYSIERLISMKAAVGSYVWSALYQQRPGPKGGQVFRPEKIIGIDSLPSGKRKTVRAWDFAATKANKGSDPDWTVGVRMSRDLDGVIYIEDIVRFRDTAGEVKKVFVATAARDGGDVRIRYPEDPGQAGKSQAEDLARAISGYSFVAVRPTGDKATRATPFASQVEAGNVRILNGGQWNATAIAEMASFPTGQHDDVVDAMADAFNELAGVVPGEGLLEYYRQEAEKVEARMRGEQQNVATTDWPVLACDNPAMSVAVGRLGKMYTRNADGFFVVHPDDAGGFLSTMGWSRVSPPPT